MALLWPLARSWSTLRLVGPNLLPWREVWLFGSILPFLGSLGFWLELGSLHEFELLARAWWLGVILASLGKIWTTFEEFELLTWTLYLWRVQAFGPNLVNFSPLADPPWLIGGLGLPCMDLITFACVENFYRKWVKTFCFYLHFSLSSFWLIFAYDSSTMPNLPNFA